MTDYTPTTEEVRESYVLMQKCSAYPNPDTEFDRWLFHMREDAWDRGYQAGLIDYASNMSTNPYRQGETE